MFKDGKKERVPDYLKEDFPPIGGEPCREYLLKQKKWGDRPPAEAFMKIANQLYLEYQLDSERKYLKQKAKDKAQKRQFERRHQSLNMPTGRRNSMAMTANFAR